MGDKFKISDLQSAKLQQEATNIDRYLGNNDGAINKRKEAKKLQALLNGDAELKAELANENDDIKKMFGYTGSAQAQQTQAAAQQAPAQQEVKEAVKADETEEKKEDKATSAKQKGEEVKEAYYRYRGVDPYTREPLKDEAGNPVKGLSPKEAYEAVEEAYKDNKERISFSVSRVGISSPGVISLSNRRRLRSLMFTTCSSMDWCTTSRSTSTFFVCPMRWARPVACSSAVGFHQGS